MDNLGNFNFKKKFGQNFLIDTNIISNIINKSDVDKDTLVLEIGPGSGNLTIEIAKRAKNVICYEIDTSLKEILDDKLKIFDNVSIKYEDFLKSNPLNDIKEYDYKKLYVIANLPYYITTPIIMKVIEDLDIDKMIIMVQKEVGDRFNAKPNSKDYNSLSIYLNYYFDINKVCDVSRNVFIPKPNVDSMVIAFTKKEKRPYLKDQNLFFKLVRDSFKQKRKTLKNNLQNYDLETIFKVLEKYGFDRNVRAEQISIDIFVEIANTLV